MILVQAVDFFVSTAIYTSAELQPFLNGTRDIVLQAQKAATALVLDPSNSDTLDQLLDSISELGEPL